MSHAFYKLKALTWRLETGIVAAGVGHHTLPQSCPGLAVCAFRGSDGDKMMKRRSRGAEEEY